MAKFQLLSCNVALAGDILNVVARHAFNPVTFPELIVLRYVHGEQAVTEVFDVGYVERDEEAEAKRIRETYKAEVYEKLFPGSGTRLPLGDNRYKRRLVGTKVNPGASVVDVPVPDATQAPGVQDDTQVDYAPAAPPAEYTPVDDTPAPPPPAADGVRPVRRPVPVMQP